MAENGLLDIALTALEDLKAREVCVLDVRRLTAITDHMVIASGTSSRHVRSIADRLIDRLKESGASPLGIEGLEGGEWVLVDCRDFVVHVMQPRVREFYKLENLWSVGSAEPAAQAD